MAVSKTTPDTIATGDTGTERSGPTNSDSPISVISTRMGDGIARKDGEEDGKKAEKESRGGVQGKGGVSGDPG